MNRTAMNLMRIKPGRATRNAGRTEIRTAGILFSHTWQVLAEYVPDTNARDLPPYFC
jgi:hypothetical protein